MTANVSLNIEVTPCPGVYRVAVLVDEGALDAVQAALVEFGDIRRDPRA